MKKCNCVSIFTVQHVSADTVATAMNVKFFGVNPLSDFQLVPNLIVCYSRTRRSFCGLHSFYNFDYNNLYLSPFYPKFENLHYSLRRFQSGIIRCL